MTFMGYPNRATSASGGEVLSQSIITEYLSCDLCAAKEHELLYSRFDPVTGREYHLVKCSCGMAFVNPMPTPESISKLYPPDYLKDKRDMTGLYNRMMEFLPQVEHGKLLDIGCGQGDFIHYAAKFGWQVQGVDLIDWKSPLDVFIRRGDFPTMELPERHFDVITAWAVLEHVRKPSLFFRKVSGLLKEDGRFIFVVPNFEAPGMSHSCTEDIPRHLHLFTPKAVDSHLNKNGMTAEAIFHTDRLYSSYPFGLLRYGLQRLRKNETRCSRYENKSVALLRNRQIRGNLHIWLAEVLRTVSPWNIAIDALDLCMGIIVAKVSKLIRNYGVITVVAKRSE